MSWIQKALSFFRSKPKNKQVITKEESFTDSPSAVASGNGRLSVVDSNTNILYNGKRELRPFFQLQAIDELKWLSVFNRHISKCVSDTVALANTEYTIEFPDGISERQKTKMIKEIRQFEREYNGGKGFQSFIKQGLESLAYSGSLPCEMVITGAPYPSQIKRIAVLNPAQIRYEYEQSTDSFIPYQYLKNSSLSGAKIRLNPETFICQTIREIEESPTGIPSLLSALEDLNLDASMIEDFKTVMKKAGLLGFLSIGVDKIPKKNGESEEAYLARSREFLRNYVVPDAEKGFSGGVMANFKGSTEVNFQANNTNYNGAEKAFEIVNKRLYNAMKSHGLFFGETGAITETFARVILQVQMSMVGDYQFAMAAVVEKILKKLLELKGFTLPYLKVVFESAMIGDTLKDAQVEAQKLANIETKLRLNIIDIYQAAQEMGYDKPTDTPYTSPNMQGSSPNIPIGDMRTDPSGGESLEKKKPFQFQNL